MKYYTWKLKWELNPDTGSEEGREPTSFSHGNTVSLEQVFYDKDTVDRTAKAYAVSAAPINVSDWSDYLMEEVTAAEVLTAAQAIDEEAILEENGRIKFTEVEPTLP